jgi:energy-coupling factor transporter ATP-binding protein EcfA2
MTTPHLDPDATPSDQLDLFLPAATEQLDVDRGLPAHIARASISPGWWKYVAPLYDDQVAVVAVDVCEEREGVLVIAASVWEEGGWSALGLSRIQDAAANTCGCCGSGLGRLFRATIYEPSRTVCDACRTRLQAGEDYLTIADDHFHLGGSRRPRPRSASPLMPAARLTGGAVLRSSTALPPTELRSLVAHIRSLMSAEIVGQHEAVSRLALLAALHVGGGLPQGSRALLVGSTGVGKSSLIRAMALALEPWDVPVIRTDAIDLTSPGWSGAPSIGTLIENALQGAAPDSDRARRAVIVIDELHHVRTIPGAEGNLAAKRQEVLSSLLALTGHGTLHFQGGEAWSSEQALVLGVGAFEGLLDLSRTPTVGDFVAAGLPLELTTRLAEEVIVLQPLREPDLVQLLRRWPSLTNLQAMCERLGYRVRIVDEAYRHAARVVTLGHDSSTARTAGGWLVAALRQELVRLLPETGNSEIVITPDSLPIPSTAMKERTEESPDEGDWDGLSGIGGHL